MNRKKWPAAAGAVLLCLALTGCGSAGGEQRVSSGGQKESGPVQVQETQIMEGQMGEEASAGEIDRDGAFALALENAEVPEDDAYNVKVEKDRENDISIWQVEFETDYGDY